MGVNFWQLSHHAGVIFSGLKLRARTLVNGTSSAIKGKSCSAASMDVCIKLRSYEKSV